MANWVFYDPIQIALSNTDSISKEISQFHSACLEAINNLFTNTQNALKAAQFERKTKILLNGLGFSIEPGEELEKLIDQLADPNDHETLESTTGEEQIDQVVEALKNKYEVIPKDWTSRYVLRDGRISTPEPKKRSLTARDMLMSPEGQQGTIKKYFKSSDNEETIEETAKKRAPNQRISKFEEDTQNKKRKQESKSQQPRKPENLGEASLKQPVHSDAEEPTSPLKGLDGIGERLDKLALEARGRKSANGNENDITFHQEEKEDLEKGPELVESVLLEDQNPEDQRKAKSKGSQNKNLTFKTPDRIKTEGASEHDDFEENILRMMLSEQNPEGGFRGSGSLARNRMTLSRPVDISGFVENIEEFLTSYDKKEFINGNDEDFPTNSEKLRLEFDK